LKNTFSDTRNLDSQVIYVQSKEGLCPSFLISFPPLPQGRDAKEDKMI